MSDPNETLNHFDQLATLDRRFRERWQSRYRPEVIRTVFNALVDRAKAIPLATKPVPPEGPDALSFTLLDRMVYLGFRHDGEFGYIVLGAVLGDGSRVPIGTLRVTENGLTDQGEEIVQEEYLVSEPILRFLLDHVKRIVAAHYDHTCPLP